jgi:YVTN family beta-propeller protein
MLVSAARLTLLVAGLLAPVAAGAAERAVQLYLQPLPPEAARLTFTVESVTAVTTGGVEHPLTLNLRTVGPTEAGRQRLLASGRLPAGTYVGFSFRVTKAALTGDRGETDLIVPDAPVRLDLPFSAAGQGAWLVWLTLRYSDSVTEGFAFSPVFAAVTPSRPVVDQLGFVTSAGWDTITVFDKRLAQAVALIDTCAGPSGLALDPRRRRVYVACARGDEVQAIDIAANEVVQRVTLSPGDQPRELALTPDGATLVSVNPGSSSVSFFDAASLARQKRIDVGSGPHSVLIDEAGRRAFVFNTLSSSVSVIDLASRSLAATLAMDAAPLRGAFDADGRRLYVVHDRSPYLTVVDSEQLQLVERARLATAVEAIAFDRVRGLVCLAGSRETSVEFYDPNALLPLYAMRTAAGTTFLSIDALDSRLYLVNPETRTLLVARLADRQVASAIDVGDGAYWVAVMGER